MQNIICIRFPVFMQNKSFSRIFPTYSWIRTRGPETGIEPANAQVKKKLETASSQVQSLLQGRLLWYKKRPIQRPF